MNDKPWPLAWLPNTEGFKFLGIMADGTRVDCEVVLKDGRFVIKDNKYEVLIGWRNYA